jgi:SNF2 family DNA or RNA helicase
LYKDAREFLVKFKFKSYRQIEWIPENWLAGAYPLQYKRFLKQVTDPPPSESSVVDPLWTKVGKVLAKVNSRYLVQWQGLPPSSSTWELLESFDPSDPDWIKANIKYNDSLSIDSYATHRKRAEDKLSFPIFQDLTEQPVGLQGGELKAHQLDGLNWLVQNWCARMPSILADEMVCILSSKYAFCAMAYLGISYPLRAWGRPFK